MSESKEMREFNAILKKMQSDYEPRDFGIDKDRWEEIQMFEVEDAWDDIEDEIRDSIEI